MAELHAWVRHRLPLWVTWPSVARQAGIEGAKLVRVGESGLGVELLLALRPPLTVFDVEARASQVAVAYGALRARAVADPSRADRVSLMLDWLANRPSVVYPDFHPPYGMPAEPLDPLPLGLDDSGRLVTANLYGKHVLIGGQPGAGKSNAIKVLAAGWAVRRNVALFGIDPKYAELGMWSERFASLVLGNEPGPAVELLTWLLDEVQRRARLLHERGVTSLPVDGDTPWLVLVVDEWAEVGAAGDDRERAHLASLLRRYVALGRAVGCTAVLATQRPTSDTIDTGTRSLLTDRFALRCGDRYQADAILPPGTYQRDELLGA